jgi:hypothetical protein
MNRKLACAGSSFVAGGEQGSITATSENHAHCSTSAEHPDALAFEAIGIRPSNLIVGRIQNRTREL